MRGKLFLVFYFFVKHKLIVTFYHIYTTKILHEEWFWRSRAMVKLGHCVSSPSNPSYCIINKHICFSDATFDIVFRTDYFLLPLCNWTEFAVFVWYLMYISYLYWLFKFLESILFNCWSIAWILQRFQKTNIFKLKVISQKWNCNKEKKCICSLSYLFLV